jgi:hypothetical protein
MRSRCSRVVAAVCVLVVGGAWRPAAVAAEECLLTMSAGLYGVQSGKEIDFSAAWINENQLQGTSMRLFVRREPETPWMSDVQSFPAPQVGTAVNMAFSKHYVTAPTAPNGMELCFTLVKILPNQARVACGQKKCTKINNIHNDKQVDKDLNDPNTPATPMKLGSKKIALPDLVVRPAGWASRSLRVTNQGLGALKTPCKLTVVGKTAQNQAASTVEFDVPSLAPGAFSDFDVTNQLYLGGSVEAWVDSLNHVEEPNDNNNAYHSK